MTFKARMVVLFTVFLVSFSFVPVSAAEAETGIKDADILLVHNPAATEEETQSIHTIVNILTYLRMSVTFCTPDECEGKLADYPNIILYNLKYVSADFLTAVAGCKSKLMIIGSDFMSSYLARIGKASLIQQKVSGAAAFRYSLYDTQPLEGLTQLKEMPVLANPEYQNGKLQAMDKEYPLFIGLDGFRFLPIIDFSGGSIQLAFTQEIENWMWVYKDQPPSYAQYFVLDEVYPFTDLNKLKNVIDMFIDARLPFVISVMPIYNNTDYPALQRFCEVLSYAQANNGAVILHAPFIQKQEPTDEEISKQITTALKAYSQYGVYPLGIQAPESWMYDALYLGILARYKTVFIYNDTPQKSSFSLNLKYNLIYASGHQLIAPVTELSEDSVSYLKAYSCAVYLDIGNELEDIKRKITLGKESYVPFKSLWRMPQTVYANDYYMNYDTKQLTFNNEVKDLTFKPFEYKPYHYQRNMLDRITMDLTSGNWGAILFVFIALIIFLLFIMVARFKNRKEFFYNEK